MNDKEIIKIRKATRAKTTEPFADTIAFATAILESRELAGWVVVDKNGVVVRSVSLKDYAPLSSDIILEYTPDTLMIEIMNRNYPYSAPHSLRKTYF